MNEHRIETYDRDKAANAVLILAVKQAIADLREGWTIDSIETDLWRAGASAQRILGR